MGCKNKKSQPQMGWFLCWPDDDLQAKFLGKRGLILESDTPAFIVDVPWLGRKVSDGLMGGFFLANGLFRRPCEQSIQYAGSG